MAEADDRFTHSGEPEDTEERRRTAERRCLEAEQRCFQAERRRYEAERRREEVEALLADARRAGVMMEQIVAELRRLVRELRDAAERPQAAHGETSDASAGDDDMVDALTAAIARLRANVQAVGEASDQRSSSADVPATSFPREAPERSETQEPSPAASAAEEVLAPRAASSEVVPVRPPHKHSMSWIARWRARRKQRR